MKPFFGSAAKEDDLDHLVESRPAASSARHATISASATFSALALRDSPKAASAIGVAREGGGRRRYTVIPLVAVFGRRRAGEADDTVLGPRHRCRAAGAPAMPATEATLTDAPAAARLPELALHLRAAVA